MNQAILDRSAIAFSLGFYDSLGAGTSIEVAYQLGCNAIDLAVNSNSDSSRTLIPINTSATNSVIPILKKNPRLGIQEIYIDPERHIGDVWTLIIPETENINKQHQITINWGSFQWQHFKNIPEKGLLLSYKKRNYDKIARIINVAPTEEFYRDGAKLITENTKIFNGYLAEPEWGVKDDINSDWNELKYSSNHLNWQWFFQEVVSIVNNITN